MSYFTKLSESAALVSGMATRLDVSMDDRLPTAPDIFARSYADMVARCAHCPEHVACARLQDENPALDAPPDYCVNKMSFTPSGD